MEYLIVDAEILGTVALGRIAIGCIVDSREPSMAYKLEHPARSNRSTAPSHSPTSRFTGFLQKW